MSGGSESSGRRNVSRIPTVTELNGSNLTLAVTLKLWATTKYFYGAEVVIAYVEP